MSKVRVIKKLKRIFAKSVTTLNIESDSIRLVTFKGREVEKFIEIPVPQGMIRNTRINDPENVAGIIKSLFKTNRISRRGVVVSLNGFRSVPRFITLPGLRTGGFKEAMKWSSHREMPVSLDTLYISSQVIEKTGKEKKVFILGTPKETRDRFLATLKTAGVKPKAIDSKSLAIGRLIDREKAICVDLEDETISTVLLVRGEPVASQTVIIRPENKEIDDRIQRLSNDLFRIVEFHNNNSDIEQQIMSDTPLFLTGSLVYEDVLPKIGRSTGYKVSIPEPDIDIPGGMSRARYAVNLGLYMRQVTATRRNKKKATNRLMLRPDIRKAKHIKI